MCDVNDRERQKHNARLCLCYIHIEKMLINYGGKKRRRNLQK